MPVILSTINTAALWQHIHWLVVLAEQGSFTAAAARLSVSKAAMSQRIADLERAAGVALVTRTTRSVRLTHAGQALVQSTQGAFEQIAHSFASIKDMADEPHGLVRITAPVAFARQQLMPCLGQFLHTYPQVRLELDLSDRLRSLAAEGFDLAIRHTAVPPDTHVAWKLADIRTVVVASPTYLQAYGKPQSPAQLALHQCLLYPRPHDAGKWHFAPRSEQTEGQHPTSVVVQGRFAANNSESLRDAAIAGLGIGLMPDFSAQAALQQGLLQEVLSDWEPMHTFGGHLFAVRPYAPHVPRAVQALVHFLKDSFASGFQSHPPIPSQT